MRRAQRKAYQITRSNETASSNLAANISTYNHEKSKAIQNLAQRANSGTALLHDLNIFYDLDDTARNSISTSYQNNDSDRSDYMNQELKEQLSSIFVSPVDLSISTLPANHITQIDITQDISASLRKNRRAFIDISTTEHVKGKDLMVPISLATNLKYGVENDFYFEVIRLYHQPIFLCQKTVIQHH